MRIVVDPVEEANKPTAVLSIEHSVLSSCERALLLCRYRCGH
jgi:hypothetical protein